MAILDLKQSGDYYHFDRAQCVAEGEKRADSYQSAKPFPHIQIDDLLDRAFLKRLNGEFPGREGRTYFDRPQERLKYQFNPNTVDSALVRNLLSELNGEPFIAFLEGMTGIKGLIPDPYFEGGGLHETLSGGHLSVHTDFNRHGRMNLERRLNLLIYLNDDWDEAFGGELELWDKKMRKSAVSIAPILARAVVFNTTLQSFHGQPNPLSCPPERSRRSIATYYYTAFEVKDDAPTRTTIFKQRPGQGDKRDWRTVYSHFVADWVPPKLQGIARRLMR